MEAETRLLIRGVFGLSRGARKRKTHPGLELAPTLKLSRGVAVFVALAPPFHRGAGFASAEPTENPAKKEECPKKQP
jgi:hypothetical protein